MKIEKDGEQFAHDKLFPVLEAAWHEGKDANVVLWGLMNCVSRVMQAKHDGDLNASAEELERMASAYAESFRKAQ